MIEQCANQVMEYFNQSKNSSSITLIPKTINTNTQLQSTTINENNPISPLSSTTTTTTSSSSQTNSSDISTNNVQNSIEQPRYIYDFSRLMLNSYYSTYYWNKAENLMNEKPLKRKERNIFKIISLNFCHFLNEKKTISYI